MLIIEVLDQNGIPPTEAVISAVKRNASYMIRSKSRRLKIRTAGLYVNISTEFEEITLEDQTGIKFLISYREKSGGGTARLMVTKQKAPVVETGEKGDSRSNTAPRSALKPRWIN